MRTPPYDPNARRKTVSVSLNSDLAAKATAAGINISRTAEAALAAAFITHQRTVIHAQIRAAAAFTDRIVAEYGLPFDDWTTEPADGAAADNAA